MLIFMEKMIFLKWELYKWLSKIMESVFCIFPPRRLCEIHTGGTHRQPASLVRYTPHPARYARYTPEEHTGARLALRDTHRAGLLLIGCLRGLQPPEVVVLVCRPLNALAPLDCGSHCRTTCCAVRYVVLLLSRQGAGQFERLD